MIRSTLRLFLYLSVFTALVMLNSSCTAEGNSCGQLPCYEGPFDPPWVSGLAFPWGPDGTPLTHDNRVLETDNFLVFSDASSDDAKIRMGDTAEACFAEIKQAFGIASSAELGISGQASKMTIYSERRKRIDPQAFSYGFIMFGYDSSIYLNSPEQQLNQRDCVKHENVHVVQFYLGGTYESVWDWFTEGVAEHVSGGAEQPIACWPEVEAWRQNPLHVNPVTVRKLSQIEQPLIQDEHYPLFGLAVRYLVDPLGHGKSLLDVKALFADIGRGVDFAAAFETRLGMSLDYYAENFYALMQAYLPVECN